MVAQLAQLLLGALVKFGFASLVCYSLVIYTLQAELQGTTDGCPYCPGTRSHHYLRLFHLNESWPTNYLSYMFDPGGIPTVNVGETARYSLNLDIFGVRVQGSGVLTGDLGTSWWHYKSDEGRPILEDLDHSLNPVFAALISSILTFAYVALMQRVGRPASYISRRQSGKLAYESHLFLDPVSFTLLGRLSRI